MAIQSTPATRENAQSVTAMASNEEGTATPGKQIQQIWQGNIQSVDVMAELGKSKNCKIFSQ